MHGTPAYTLTGLIARVGLYLSHMHMHSMQVHRLHLESTHAQKRSNAKKIEPTETVRHAIGALQGASPSASNAPYVEFLIWALPLGTAAADTANCTVAAVCTGSTALGVLSICTQEDLQTVFAMLKQFLIR